MSLSDDRRNLSTVKPVISLNLDRYLRKIRPIEKLYTV